MPVPTVILCGGRGTRLREVATEIPKPMVPIGGRPILWHIMKLYSAHGFDDFVLALGHLGDRIREFVLHYEAYTADFTLGVGGGSLSYLDGEHPEKAWRVTCIDTGTDALTGTRVRRATRHLDAERIMVTYGDGLGDVDIAELLRFHESHGRLATVTAVRPPGRFGELLIGDDDVVQSFEEKPQTSAGTISGGFMVFEREAIERFIPADDDVMLEREPLQGLAAAGQLVAWRHEGFWQPMDTPREMDLLVGLWESGAAPWKAWA